VKKVIAGIAGVVILVALKFIVPSLQVEATNATGAGWDDAKAEMNTTFMGVLTQEYSAFALPPATLTTISNCITDRAVAYLNTTDCSYLYNPNTTSESEHLAQQEACMVKVEYEQKEADFTIQCTKENFPEDWKHMQTLLGESFTAVFVAQGVPEATAKTASACVAQKAVALINQRKCPLVNKAATKGEEMFYTIDDCIKDPENDAEFQAIWTTCTPATK